MKALRWLTVMLVMWVGLAHAQGLEVEVKPTGQWDSGFNGELVIRNTGPTAVNGWTVVLQLRGVSITSAWSGNLQTSGNTYTITNSSWNGSIPAGATLGTPPGFGANGRYSADMIVSCTINGAPCAGGGGGPEQPPTLDVSASPARFMQAGDVTVTAIPHSTSGIREVDFFLGSSNTPVHVATSAPYKYTRHFAQADNGSYYYSAIAYDVHELASQRTPANPVTVDIGGGGPGPEYPRWPEGIGSYQIGTVVIGKDGELWECVRHPNWCNESHPARTPGGPNYPPASDATRPWEPHRGGGETPTVTLTAQPAELAQEGSVTVTAQPGPGVVKVDLTHNGQPAGSVLPGHPVKTFHFTRNDNGTQNFGAIAYNAQSQPSAPANASMTVNIGEEPPLPGRPVVSTIATPNLVTAPGPVEITVTANDEHGLRWVELYLNGKEVKRDNVGGTSHTLHYTWDVGSHEHVMIYNFQARAQNSAGEHGISRFASVKVDIPGEVEPPPPLPGDGLVPGKTLYAPYFYTWAWGNGAGVYAFSNLMDMLAQSHQKAVTLAFLLGNGHCEITTTAGTTDNLVYDNLDDVIAYEQAGGHIRASFGGANGPYLEEQCSSAQQMFEALDTFVRRTGIHDLDFDIENAGGYGQQASEIRSQAIALLQQKEPAVTVSFTLAITGHDFKWGTPAQLTEGVKVLEAAKAAGVRIDAVNPMLMEYGDYFWNNLHEAGKTPGDMAVQTLEDMHAQLRRLNLFEGMSDAELWHRIGATPMIGRNGPQGNDPKAAFNLSDVPQLVAFARQHKLVLVSHWAIHRDQPCPMPNPYANQICNNSGDPSFAFNRQFAKLHEGGEEPGGVPKVSVVAPASVTEAGTEHITVNATDDKGLKSVVLRLDGDPVAGEPASGTSHSLTYDWQLNAGHSGMHTFQATAMNVDDKEGVSNAAPVTVNIPPGGGGTPPTVSASVAPTQLTQAGSSATVTVRASDAKQLTRITLYRDNTLVKSELQSGTSGTLNFIVPADGTANGDYDFYAVAENSDDMDADSNHVTLKVSVGEHPGDYTGDSTCWRDAVRLNAEAQGSGANAQNNGRTPCDDYLPAKYVVALPKTAGGKDAFVMDNAGDIVFQLRYGSAVKHVSITDLDSNQRVCFVDAPEKQCTVHVDDGLHIYRVVGQTTENNWDKTAEAWTYVRVGRSGGNEFQDRRIAYFGQWKVYSANHFLGDMEQNGTLAKLTHLQYAFGNLSPDGECKMVNYLEVGNDTPTSPYAGDGGDAWADTGAGVGAHILPHGATLDTWDNTLRGNMSRLKQIKAKYPNLRVMISLGGWSWSKYFATAADTAEGRTKLAQSCINMWLKGNLPLAEGGMRGGVGAAAGIFDGIDIDWEFPGGAGQPYNHVTPRDKHNFTLLLQEFRRQMDAYGRRVGRHFELSVAVGAGQEKIDHTEPGDYSQYLDYLGAMTYDYHGGWEMSTAHQSQMYADPNGKFWDVPGQPLKPVPVTEQLSMDNSIRYLMDHGAPANKLVVGLPFYGRGWTGVQPGDNGKGIYQAATGPAPGVEPGFQNYNVLKGLPNTLGYQVYRDNNVGAWLYSPTTQIFWSYDDPQEIGRKAEYVSQHHLGGVLIWDSSGDDAQGSLINAVNGKLH